MNEELNIIGYVRATDWDWQDEVCGIIIETDDEEYVVEPNRIEKLLFHKVDYEVELTGTVEQTEDGINHIRITSFSVLSEPDVVEMEEDEDYDVDKDYDVEENYEFEKEYELEFDQENYQINRYMQWAEE